MKVATFMANMQAYYGGDDTAKGLTPYARTMLVKYLSGYHESKLNLLQGEGFKNHPVKFGVPGIAVIEEIHRVYTFGDQRKGLDSHSSLKIDRSVSACAPVKEEDISEEEQNEVKKMMDDAGGLLGLIGQGGW